jgi:hypothetical protein
MRRKFLCFTDSVTVANCSLCAERIFLKLLPIFSWHRCSIQHSCTARRSSCVLLQQNQHTHDAAIRPQVWNDTYSCCRVKPWSLLFYRIFYSMAFYIVIHICCILVTCGSRYSLSLSWPLPTWQEKPHCIWKNPDENISNFSPKKQGKSKHRHDGRQEDSTFSSV